MRDMINSAHRLKGEGVLSDSRSYWEHKEALVREEQEVLRALAFDTGSSQQFAATLLLGYLCVMRVSRPLCELSCALIGDSAGAPSLVGCPPNLLAAAALHLASCLLKRPIAAQVPFLPPRSVPLTSMPPATRRAILLAGSTVVGGLGRRRGGAGGGESPPP